MLIRALVSLLFAAAAATAQSPEDAEYFEKSVRPLLVAKCQMCHSAQLKTAELDLSSAEGFVKGGAGGPLVNKEHPEQSVLLKVVSYDEKLKMPPTGKLADSEIAVLKQWVGSGAYWPGADKVQVVEHKKGIAFTAEQKGWWAFQPVSDPAPPAVKDVSWAKSPIDRFILAKIEEKSLTPAPPAQKATLLRRASYDLTGMPPPKPSSKPSWRTHPSAPSSAPSTASSTRPATASAGAATGSMSPVTPTPPATTRITVTRTRTATATT